MQGWVTSGAYRGFAAIKDQWWCLIVAQIEEKPELKQEKYRKPNAWKKKIRKPQITPKPKNRSFFSTKTEKTDLKNNHNCKTPNAPPPIV